MVKKIIAIMFAMGLLLTLAACHVTTGRAACDARVGPVAKADIEGYHFDCTPPSNFEVHLGWADHANHKLYVWVDYHGLSDPAVRPILIKVMWHEVGHAVLYRLVGNQLPESTREWWADGFSWCAEPQAGVSYLNRPTAAQCPTYLGA